ncbi:unnamed protein product, partial [Prorocentrum cordatum]
VELVQTPREDAASSSTAPAAAAGAPGEAPPAAALLQEAAAAAPSPEDRGHRVSLASPGRHHRRARRRWLGRARRKPQRPRSGRSPGTWPRVATAARAARCPAISAAPPRRGGSSWPRPRCRGSRGGWSVWWTGTPLVPWAPSTRPTRAPAEHPAALATGAQKSLRRRSGADPRLESLRGAGGGGPLRVDKPGPAARVRGPLPRARVRAVLPALPQAPAGEPAPCATSGPRLTHGVSEICPRAARSAAPRGEPPPGDLAGLTRPRTPARAPMARPARRARWRPRAVLSRRASGGMRAEFAVHCRRWQHSEEEQS